MTRNLFIQRLRDAIPAFVFIVISFVLIILHQCGIDFEITLLGETATSFNFSLVSISLGMIIILLIPIIDGGKIRSNDKKEN